METRTDILNELATLSPLLARLQKENIFFVPEGYFEYLGPTIIACIREDQIIQPVDQEFENLPIGYFDNLASSILDKIKDQQPVSAVTELKQLSPLLSGIRPVNVLEVPEGYFNQLPGTILDKVQPKTGRMIQMFSGTVLKYAAAAIITLVAAFSVYQYIEKPVSKPAIAKAAGALDETVEKGRTMNEQQFNETLNSLSEEDIAKYLEKNADEADVAVLTSNLEGNNLPNQEDYLLNDKTLENYINEIETKELDN